MRQFSPLIIFVLLVSEAATPSLAADNDQQRAAVTLKRMDAIANSIQAYIANAHGAPDATSIESLRSLLSPAYITTLPIRDEWNRPFRYVKTGNQSFQIISAGSDGKFDEKSWSVEAHTNDFAADAVYVKSGPEVPGTFRRIWIDSLGAPLATSRDEMKADMQSLVREELAKTQGMSQEEGLSYLAASGTKRTMKALSMLIELYGVKHGAYPQAKSITDLAAILLPDSAADVQKTDWWGTEYRYETSSHGKTYRLISAGKDRNFNAASWDERGTLATTDDDAVIRNGEFVRMWDEHTRPGLSAEARKRTTLQPAARALLERADALHDRGDDAEALEAYMEAVKADPAAADLATIRRYAPIPTYITLVPPSPPAKQQAEEQRFEKASARQVAALKQYLQLRPNDWEATKVLVFLVDWPEAESLLEPVFKSRPRDPELYAARASLLARHHRFDAALDDETKAAELDDQNPERYYNIGVVAYEAVAKEASLKADQKRTFIRRGLAALERAEVLRPDYFESMTYRNLLVRQKALLETDPVAQEKLIAEADAIRQRAIEVIKRRRAASQDAEVQPPKTEGDAKPPPQTETGPLEVGGDVKAPVVLRRVEAVYPEEARKHGVSSIAILQLAVDKTGRVARASVLKPVDYGGSEAALTAVKQWTFRPATRNGEPVDAIFNVTVRIGPVSAP